MYLRLLPLCLLFSPLTACTFGPSDSDPQEAAPASSEAPDAAPTPDAGQEEPETVATDAGAVEGPEGPDAGSAETPGSTFDAGPEPCAPCAPGLALNPSDCSCNDIDECETNNGGCDPNATCTNAAVSGEAATCACASGHFGDGATCAPWSACEAAQFETAAPTATSDRACAALTECDSSQYETTAATATSDRACTALTVCAPSQYESTAATVNSDRVCTAVTSCGADATETQAPTATSDRQCACNTGYEGDGVSCTDVDLDDDGVLTADDCDDENPNSTVVSEDPGCAFETALRTGDAAGLDAPAVPLSFALGYLSDMSVHVEANLRAIYGDEALTYVPGAQSQWINTIDYQNKFALVQGEKGNTLAIAGTQEGTPCAAFGDNIIRRFDRGEQLAFEPAFKRLLSWMVAGDADTDDELAMAFKTVALMGLGNHTNNVSGWLGDHYPSTATLNCDDPLTAAACVAGTDLVVVGAAGQDEDAETIGLAVMHAFEIGVPVAYMHTRAWNETPYGNEVLAAMDMSIGPYGGNFWAQDQAVWPSIGAFIDAGGPLDAVATVLSHLQDEDFDFDFSACTTYVGKTSCDGVTGLASEFLTGAGKIKTFMKQLDETGQSLFELEGKRFWKSVLLYADLLRQSIEYPMSKSNADVLPFFKAYFADHVVHYARNGQLAQPDLGTFAAPIDASSVELGTVDKTVPLSLYGGFTAAGVYLLPGQAVTVQRLDDEDVDVWVKVNTQRTGSTREWNDNKYDRPKYLQSPTIPVDREAALTLSSPYGGVLQVVSDATDTATQIQLRVSNVGEHPVLAAIGEADAYLAALQNSPYPITELKMAGVEIHSRTDKMLEAINAEPYSGDLSYFFEDLERYMITDTYNLAGYAGEGLSLNDEVAAFCTAKNWDCTSETVHAKPSTQHINVDVYAHCGGGCSGNPYDQTWPLDPLGWGETHEIGHNLQPKRLKIYEGKSTEVSNQIFPLFKHYTYKQEMGESLSATRVKYQLTFEILQAALSTTDPVQHVYDAVWANDAYAANNGERMAFYVQLIHTSDALAFLNTGWDLYTLLYLQDRLFEQAVKNQTDWDDQKDRLGFSTYASPPNSIDGNDFMLVAVSFITQKDQRDFFDMWGITYSTEASNQVAAFGFSAAPKVHYANDDTNTDPNSTPLSIDGTTPWSL